uniref:Uncharacterized protein n=1 Tax=Euplotes crassus TaxID=5936 RepID=A0A7S3K6J0_EUPCR|mmetsp:Transcript_12197/g.12217  ORF Transcript_12197/g.12217 Transcript_12197/m.12217 type:complete len:200 (+) Transcript_12197:568-1167(+)|eukprot:CAMPEP_0197010170 /NCGR_PEP_ID=MMETSP1380-20130617/53080_1 /TAXON_ID=5936 /ORGANISM="Euplotes crassus, Strain CT5" /LENGTH=199 /DNA_ID=CAMNT_0042431913 /DNA_START=563 /DNA_END=1162 /DNA_ORIENTATION=-
MSSDDQEEIEEEEEQPQVEKDDEYFGTEEEVPLESNDEHQENLIGLFQGVGLNNDKPEGQSNSISGFLNQKNQAKDVTVGQLDAKETKEDGSILDTIYQKHFGVPMKTDSQHNPSRHNFAASFQTPLHDSKVDQSFGGFETPKFRPAAEDEFTGSGNYLQGNMIGQISQTKPQQKYNAGFEQPNFEGRTNLMAQISRFQ